MKVGDIVVMTYGYSHNTSVKKGDKGIITKIDMIPIMPYGFKEEQYTVSLFRNSEVLKNQRKSCIRKLNKK